MRKWIREASSKGGKMKDSIIGSFNRCNLLVALDGSENDELNFVGISNAISLCAR